MSLSQVPVVYQFHYIIKTVYFTEARPCQAVTGHKDKLNQQMQNTQGREEIFTLIKTKER